MKKFLFLFGCIALASLGGLLCGYDTGVISGALLYMDNSFEINPFSQGLIVASVSLGAVLGAFLNGFFADKIGRKNTILLLAFIFALGSFLCSISQSAEFLVFSRMFTGLALGIASFACPLYLSELSPKDKRGRIVSFYQLALTFGILFSYFSNYFCSNFELNWRIMLFIGLIPALVLFLGIMFSKDTPRWLVMKGRIEEAKEILKKIDDSQDIDSEIENIKKTLINSNAKFTKKLIKPFVIAIGMMFCQIVTGINAIIYYTPTIFKNIGFSSNKDVLLITIFIGIVNFLMTFVAILYVDKIGRKPLLYIGLSGMGVSLLFISFAFVLDFEILKYLTVFAVGFYIVCFSMSLGPIALLINSEIFPLEFRAQAMSIAIVSNFIFNFIVTGLFPVFMAKFGGFITFIIFFFICIISLIFIKTVVIETKDKSLEEIEREFSNFAISSYINSR